jgi:hypothetical protein
LKEAAASKLDQALDYHMAIFHVLQHEIHHSQIRIPGPEINKQIFRYGKLLELRSKSKEFNYMLQPVHFGFILHIFL